MQPPLRPFRPLWQFVVVTACLAAGPQLAACGPYSILEFFWLDRQPGPELERFLGGDLGILTNSQRDAYRYVAYRHLAGLETGDGNASALATLWQSSSIATTKDPQQAWIDARNIVPDIEPLRWLDRSRNKAIGEGDSVTYEYFFNCLDDALRTAAATLTARIERFGEASKEVRAWTEAQDMVFANCSQGEAIPEPLDDSWDPLIRADRDYQIAAATFYTTRYRDAEVRFRALAQNADSPWRELSAYLVARAQIRDGRFKEAAEELRRVIADAKLASVHESAKRLLGYVSLRSEPGARHRELGERLNSQELDFPLSQTFIDYRWTLKHHDQVDELDELGRWLRATERRSGDHEAAPSVDPPPKPKQQDLPWLVAALVSASPEDPNLAALLNAAAAIPTESSAALTATYHRARLLIGSGRDDEARALLDALLATPTGDLSTADHNRLRFQRAEIEPDLESYLRLMAMPPVALGWDDGTGDPGMDNPGSVFPAYRFDEPMLTSSAIELLNHGLTTEEMLRLTEGDTLPDSWRKRLALATWTRAVTTGHDGVAMAVAPLVASLAPELGDEMASFSAATGADRRFAAAWTLLRFPGLSPVLRWNVGRRTPISERDDLRDNGWCAGVLDTPELPHQRVRNAQQVAAVRAALPAGGLDAAPRLLGQIVLLRADSHPEDPRLPEALHEVVLATRFGCPMGGYADVSRAAFRLLHQRFPKSTWAEQTPYWYD